MVRARPNAAGPHEKRGTGPGAKWSHASDHITPGRKRSRVDRGWDDEPSRSERDNLGRGPRLDSGDGELWFVVCGGDYFFAEDINSNIWSPNWQAKRHQEVQTHIVAVVKTIKAMRDH